MFLGGDNWWFGKLENLATMRAITLPFTLDTYTSLSKFVIYDDRERLLLGPSEPASWGMLVMSFCFVEIVLVLDVGWSTTHAAVFAPLYRFDLLVYYLFLYVCWVCMYTFASVCTWRVWVYMYVLEWECVSQRSTSGVVIHYSPFCLFVWASLASKSLCSKDNLEDLICLPPHVWDDRYVSSCLALP